MAFALARTMTAIVFFQNVSRKTKAHLAWLARNQTATSACLSIGHESIFKFESLALESFLTVNI